MLTTTSQYGLRSLIHLARLSEDTSILGHDLAERANIPPNYLSKILVSLRNAGFIETTRGRGGGYRLSKLPSEIVLKDVVGLFEKSFGETPCLMGEQKICSQEHQCTAHDAWEKVCQSYSDFLNATTIEDIAFEAGRKNERNIKKAT